MSPEQFHHLINALHNIHRAQSANGITLQAIAKHLGVPDDGMVMVKQSDLDAIDKVILSNKSKIDALNSPPA